MDNDAARIPPLAILPHVMVHLRTREKPMNKITSLLILVALIITSCESDNFYETERYFRTDKTEYEIGDTIILTALIRPIEETKTIRLYDNYSNIEISFALMNPELKMQNDEWTDRTGRNLSKNKINELTITRKESFIKNYEAVISEENDNIFIAIPKMDYKVSLNKTSVLHPKTRVRIHGFCNPINPEFGASLEEYFEVKDIRIREKNAP